MTTRRDIEHREQRALFEWARLQSRRTPELDLMYAIPNGGDRNPVVAGKLKAEGVRAGVPDICLPVARNGHHALYIELKRPADPVRGVRAGQVTDAQHRWSVLLRDAGNHVVVAYGWDAAREAIIDYLEE